MAQVNFRIDDETKRQAEELFSQMGLTMSSAIMVFIRQSINDQGIPFKISAKNAAYHEELLQAKRDWENGRKNFHEHTDEEVERLIAQAEKTNKRQKKHSAQRRPARRRGCLHEESLVRQGLGTVQRNHSD